MFACQFSQRVTAEGRAIRATREDAGVFECNAQQEPVQGRRIFKVELLFARLNFVKRRLRNVNVAPLHQLRHLAVEKRQQQRADVRAVHVGVCHDDDAVVA